MRAYKLMCFDRNINGNREVKFLECDYLLVQRCVKLTLGCPMVNYFAVENTAVTGWFSF